MSIKNIFYLLILFFFIKCESYKSDTKFVSNCNNEIDTVYINRKYDSAGLLKEIEEINRNDSSSRVLSFYTNGNLKGVKSILKGVVFGDNEVYFTNGKLQEYKFLVDSAHASFISRYDMEGRCVGYQGTPLAFKLIGTNKANDTLDVKFVFADKIFSSISCKISSDGINYFPVEFEPCDNEFRTNKVYRHIQNISNTEKIKLFFKITTVDRYAKKEMLYYDTLSLLKTR